MKKETKTGRWKYAAIVLIAALLIGLLWNHVKNGPKGEIYLYGEEHSKQSILDKELSIWGEYTFHLGRVLRKRNAGSVCGIPVYGCTISEPVDAGRR